MKLKLDVTPDLASLMAAEIKAGRGGFRHVDARMRSIARQKDGHRAAQGHAFAKVPRQAVEDPAAGGADRQIFKPGALGSHLRPGGCDMRLGDANILGASAFSEFGQSLLCAGQFGQRGGASRHNLFQPGLRDRPAVHQTLVAFERRLRLRVDGTGACGPRFGYCDLLVSRTGPHAFEIGLRLGQPRPRHL